MVTVMTPAQRLEGEPLERPPVDSVGGVWRKGVEEVAPDDVVGAAKLMFGECVQAMHCGGVREWSEAWMREELLSTSAGLPYSLDATTREGWILKYNKIITEYYGSPAATMVFTITGAARIGPRSARLFMSIDIKSPERQFSERRQMDHTFDDSLILTHIHMALPLDELTAAAVIHPVRPKKKSPTTPPTVQKPTPAGVQAPTYTRPCLHNLWDSVRTKKGVALLRCRTCVAQWKLPASEVRKCKKFLQTPPTCHLGTLCPQLHVHARKKTYEDRMAGGEQE